MTDRLKKDGYGIIIDGLLNEEMIDFVKETQAQGYQADVTVLVAPKRILDCNVVERYLDRRDLINRAALGKVVLDKTNRCSTRWPNCANRRPNWWLSAGI